MDEPVQSHGTDTSRPQFLTFRGEPEAQAKLMEAMAKARLEFGQVERDRTGQYGNQRFPYATLGSLTAVTATALAKHGVTVVNMFTTSPVSADKHRLTTWVQGHGAQIEACLDFAPKEVKEAGEYRGEWIKEYGKLQTYLIRYQYRSLFTLDSEPDADEAPAPERPIGPRREPPKVEPRQEARPAPAPQRAPAPAPKATLPPEPVKQAPPPMEVKGVNTVNVANDVAPTPEPKTVREEPDRPVDDDTFGAIRDLCERLRDEGKLNKLQYSERVLTLTGLPPSELRSSQRAAMVVLEWLQTLSMGPVAQGARA